MVYKMKNVFLFLISFMAFSFAGVNELVQEGTEFHDKGKYDYAIAKYKEAEKLDPKRALVKYELGYSYYAKGDVKQALQFAKEAERLNQDPRLVESIASMVGTIYDAMKMPDSSLEAYKAGFAKAPHSYNIPFNAGVTCMGAKRDVEAAEWFVKATRNTKLHPSTYYYLTFVSENLGNWTDVFSYGMYSLLLTQKKDQMQNMLRILYQNSKGLVTVRAKDTITMNLPKKSKKADLHDAFILAYALANMDSLGNRKFYEKDTTSEQIAEYLAHMFKDAVELIAGFDESHYSNVLTPFYKGLVKENLVDAFVYTIVENADRSVYAKWRLIHANDSKRFYDWIHAEFLKVKK